MNLLRGLMMATLFFGLNAGAAHAGFGAGSSGSGAGDPGNGSNNSTRGGGGSESDWGARDNKRIDAWDKATRGGNRSCGGCGRSPGNSRGLGERQS